MIRRGSSPADNFARISNAALRDERLSWKARGLLGYLMSHSEGWQTSVLRLARVGPDGRDSVRAGLAELIQHGYLQRSEKRQRDDKGRLRDYDYEVTDVPTTGFPTLGYPTLDNPPPKKNKSKKNNPKNSTSKASPENRGGLASDAQRAWLVDLDALATRDGRWPLELAEDLSNADAHAMIQEALAFLGRGANYTGPLPGDPGWDLLSPAGQDAARRRLIPRRA